MRNDDPLFATTEDEAFANGSNVYRSSRPGELGCSVDSLSFSESWPDSERPSTVELVQSFCYTFYAIYTVIHKKRYKIFEYDFS